MTLTHIPLVTGRWAVSGSSPARSFPRNALLCWLFQRRILAQCRIPAGVWRGPLGVRYDPQTPWPLLSAWAKQKARWPGTLKSVVANRNRTGQKGQSLNEPRGILRFCKGTMEKAVVWDSHPVFIEVLLAFLDLQPCPKASDALLPPSRFCGSQAGREGLRPAGKVLQGRAWDGQAGGRAPGGRAVHGGGPAGGSGSRREPLREGLREGRGTRRALPFARPRVLCARSVSTVSG